MQHPDIAAACIYTRFVDNHIAELVASNSGTHRRLYVEQQSVRTAAGARVDALDPLAVLAYGKGEGAPPLDPQVVEPAAPA